jgi:hypothetical protein
MPQKVHWPDFFPRQHASRGEQRQALGKIGLRFAQARV